jgi:tetratricopeptide (TPR) repeat protein
MADTEAARTDMRFASKYLEQKQFSEAREYVTSARRKDPNVTLAVKTESKTVAELTPNSLEADILVEQTRVHAEQIDSLTAEMKKLYDKRMEVIDRNSEKLLKLDGMTYVEEHNKQQLEKQYDDELYSHKASLFNSRIDSLRAEIVRNLQEAIQLNPVSNFYALLGAVYVDQKNFIEAVELLTPVQQKNPENFEIRRALDAAIKGKQHQDALDAAPKTYHPPPSKPINVFAWSLIVGLACVAIAFLIANYESSHPKPPPNSPEDLLIAAGYFARIIAFFALIVAFFARKFRKE